jgi:hypothetical protein
MDKKLLELLHKQDMFYFVLGSLISADNNITEEEQKCNKEELTNIVSLIEQLIENKESWIPDETLMEYRKHAMDSLQIF